VPNVFKSGSLSLLEPSGPVQAYNGTALPLLYTVVRTAFAQNMMKDDLEEVQTCSSKKI